jgi:hypothetical protein
MASHTGYFRAAGPLSGEWLGCDLLARVYEQAGLTNREAEVALLYYQGKLPHEIATLLHIPWKEVWRSLRKVNISLRREFPRLGEIIDRMQDTDSAESRALWNAYQNKRTFSDHGPLLGQDERKNVYAVGGGASMATAGVFSVGRITPLDVLELLLMEMEEKQRKASLEKILVKT